MGRVVGLSWIFCVKRVFVFCLRDLYHLAKTLRTLLTGRSNLKYKFSPFVSQKKKYFYFFFNGGRYKARTCDPLNVVQVRYQLRQSPMLFNCHLRPYFGNFVFEIPFLTLKKGDTQIRTGG